MFNSLRGRLFLTYLLISGLILTIVAISLLIFLLRNPVVEQLTYRRLEVGFNAIPQLEMQLQRGRSSQALNRILERVDNASGLRIILLGVEGSLLADSRPDGPNFPPAVAGSIVANSGRHQSRYRDEQGGLWLYEARPVGQNSWLVTIAPRPSLRSIAVWGSELWRPLFQAAIVAIALAILLSWLISRWVSAPLNMLARISEEVAEGRYGQDFRIDGPREVESLAGALSNMVEKVEASQQVQRDFLANVSHDLKTPLTSIQGFAQAILDGTAEDHDTVQHAAQVIHDESDRLRRMVDDLLDLARLDAGQIVLERERVDLDRMLHAVLERQTLRAKETNVTIKSSIPELPDIVGDGDRLAQVFTNLLDNAIKHTPHGGSVKLWGEVESGWVSVHIQDSGPGIPEGDLSRIFDRFYQVDQARTGGAGRGVGLGLSISQEIIQGHEGRIVVQSKEGVGSCFTVQLPVVRADDSTLVRSPTT